MAQNHLLHANGSSGTQVTIPTCFSRKLQPWVHHSSFQICSRRPKNPLPPSTSWVPWLYFHHYNLYQTWKIVRSQSLPLWKRTSLKPPLRHAKPFHQCCPPFLMVEPQHLERFYSKNWPSLEEKGKLSSFSALRTIYWTRQDLLCHLTFLLLLLMMLSGRRSPKYLIVILIKHNCANYL